MIAMESAVAERLGYLQRYKDMATFKIAALQKSLEDSVPSSELEVVNKQYTELTEKYRDMLERSNSLVARSEENSGFEVCSILTASVYNCCGLWSIIHDSNGKPVLYNHFAWSNERLK